MRVQDRLPVTEGRLLRGLASKLQRLALTVLLAAGTFHGTAKAAEQDFSEPWKKADRALVVDAYEYNSIDWQKLSGDKRIIGFINKGSDGLPPPYACSGTETEIRLCKALWKRHAVARELFHTRKVVAKALGLEWGAYHLGRPGNPIEQAQNFLDFAEPGPDDLMALDIEENDPEKWMSLEDAEIFVRYIFQRTGRYPILYTNGATSRYIADNRYRYQLLSRLPLWYARYKPEIGIHFPKGNWQGYTLWQFSAQANCGERRCPYRVAGTGNDIDVNVAPMDADALRKAWPFGRLIEATDVFVASVPVPIARDDGVKGESRIRYASVAYQVRLDLLANALRSSWNKAVLGTVPAVKALGSRYAYGMAEYAAVKLERRERAVAYRRADLDPVSTASTELDRAAR
ncbi:glycoside hydrolase family 25 protein [Aminobacter sp. BE322]|uniref:glycoside hydrolase family 25 protein n=1 Tax=unclassified Aminobacter TaxID=2644704 RepID=UPI003D249240